MIVNPLFSGSTLCSTFAYESHTKRKNSKDSVIKKLQKEDFRIDSANEDEIKFSCKEYKFLFSIKSNQIKVLTTAKNNFEKCLIDFLRDGLRRAFQDEGVFV
ncbi:hypothetical protein [Bacillus thuringiensis]|uniref:hypothetical protein n=1 Tax=Bacillus thuringiensis TaxID=1428 RepID=UPI0021B3065D|nr:hypothetical protein [Bacillus thuringiensis]